MATNSEALGWYKWPPQLYPVRQEEAGSQVHNLWRKICMINRIDSCEWIEFLLCRALHALEIEKKVNSGLDLRINGMDVEQVQCFKFLGVLVNDTLTWSDYIDTRSPVAWISFVAFLGFSFSLSFFSILSLTFFSRLTTAMLSRLDALRMKLFAWTLC